MSKILVIAGSNGSNSINQWFAQEIAKDNDVDYLDTRTLNAPYYSMDIEETTGIPQEILDLHNKIKEYGKLIIVSPEYNSYMPAFLKSITDWMSRYERFYFEDVDIVIVAVTPGKRAGASVREALNNMFSFTKANILGDYGIAHFDFENDYSEEIKEILKLIK